MEMENKKGPPPDKSINKENKSRCNCYRQYHAYLSMVSDSVKKKSTINRS